MPDVVRASALGADIVKTSVCSTRHPSISDSLGDDSVDFVHKVRSSEGGSGDPDIGDNVVVSPSKLSTPLPTLLSTSRENVCKQIHRATQAQRVNNAASEQMPTCESRNICSHRMSTDTPCKSRRPHWDISTRPVRRTGVELMPSELEKRGVFWGDILWAREVEKTPRVARVRQHLAENRPPSLERGGAQSKATKAFQRHPRVWARITPPARRETYHYYPKIQHDSRDPDADFVDAGVQRVMLRMNPRIQKYFEWFDGLVDNLKPAAVEICEQAYKLQQLGIFDDALKNTLLQRIQDGLDNADVQQGSRASTRCVKQGAKPDARTERIDRLKRDLMMFLSSIEANVDAIENEAREPSQEFLKRQAIQKVDCFLAQALLASSRP